MQNGLAPDYLVDLVPPRAGNETPYSLRNADNYQQVHANSRLYFDSFLPSTIREWNNLPPNVKSAQTLTSFKYKFERNIPKIPKYYYFGDRGNQILHTRLRTECSTLKFHLYRRNLIPEPYCTCGAVENTSHFLNVRSSMPFVENYCLQLAIMLNHRKLFSCSGMIHYQMKVMKSFSVQFINIYNKPNDFHQIFRLMYLTRK